MKVKYVKFSDERRRKFCIKTVIGKDCGIWKVRKTAIFEEGVPHIKNIIYNAELLKKYYDADVCKVILCDNTAEFEYISGESLEEKYIFAMKRCDIEAIKELLLLHKKLILGNKDNETVFSESDDFREVFGNCSLEHGVRALKCCNYDAIAGNILFVKDKPVFIDYEWVFNFPVPVDIVLYHCVQNFYEHYPDMENVFSLSQAMEYLGVKTDICELDKSYRSFYDYVISDGKEEGFALMKAICLKNTQKFQDVQRENIVNRCECERLQGVIDDLNRQMFDEKLKADMQLDDVRNELQRVATEAFIKQNELESKINNIEKTLFWKIYRIFRRK